jgi:hypothetical protein
VLFIVDFGCLVTAYGSFASPGEKILDCSDLDNARQENDYTVELSAAQNTALDKALTTFVLLFMDLVETGKSHEPMIIEPHGFEISSCHSYLKRESCHIVTTSSLL